MKTRETISGVPLSTMNQKGNFGPNPYNSGVPGWGESPMHQRGPHPGGQPGIWGHRGPPPHNRFEQRGPPGHSPTPRGQFSPMYTSSPFMEQQTPHQQHRMNRSGGGSGSPRFHHYGGRHSGGGQYPSPRHGSPGQGRNSRHSGNDTDIDAYYNHSMVEDPWKGLTATPRT